MCQAEKWYEELGRESYYEYDCDDELYYLSHGFIFTDGSVLEIGIGEDHRIIDMKDWVRYHIATYTIIGGEADLRVHGYLTWRQADKFVKACEVMGIDKIYVDVYDEVDDYRGAIEYDYIPSWRQLMNMAEDLT